MGGMFSGPKMPKMKPPKMPETPRMRDTTDPDIEKRARMRLAAKRKGRRSTLLSESTQNKNQITRQSLGGSTGNNYPGLSKG